MEVFKVILNYEIAGSRTETISSTEKQISTGGYVFLISSDVDMYIGTNNTDFFVPAKTLINIPLTCDRLKVRGSDSGNVYLLLLNG